MTRQPLPRDPFVILDAGAPEEEWLAVRKLGLGGSDVAAACGLSPWRTPYALWLEKTGRIEPTFDDVTRERFHWGHVLEPVLLEEFDRRHPELILTGGDGVYADASRPWMLANVDGLAWTPDQELAGIVEAKTGTHRALPDWEDDDVPTPYTCQIQWYMAILGAPRAYVVALLDTSTYLERVVERDDDLIADLVDAAADFWCRCLDDTSPPVDGSDATRRALARWPADAGHEIELDPLWTKAIRRRREISDDLKVLTAERDQIDNCIRAAMGSAEVAYVDGEHVASNKAPGKPIRTVDLDRLAAEWPTFYAEYVTEKPAGRRLRVTRKDTTE